MQVDVHKQVQRARLATEDPRRLCRELSRSLFLRQREFSDEYDLVIEKKGDTYNVSWITNGKLSAVGVGMEVKMDWLSVGAESRISFQTRVRFWPNTVVGEGLRTTRSGHPGSL
jgi:hypothetical protein